MFSPLQASLRKQLVAVNLFIGCSIPNLKFVIQKFIYGRKIGPLENFDEEKFIFYEHKL